MRDRPRKLNQLFVENFNYVDEKGRKNESFFVSLFKNSELTHLICREAIALKMKASSSTTFSRFIENIIDAEISVYMRRFVMSDDDSVNRDLIIRTSKAKGDFEKRLVQALIATELAMRGVAEFEDYQRKALLCLADRIQALPDKISHTVTVDKESGEIPTRELDRYGEIYHHFLSTGEAMEGYAEVFTNPLDARYVGIDLSKCKSAASKMTL